MTKKIIFFDTETTGNTDKDFLCQIAFKEMGGESFSGLYKPPIKIPPEASAVHHISNKMIEDKPSFNENPDHQKIKDLFENPENVVVAHNAIFDLAMLKKENINPINFICTLRVARFLDKEGKIEKYNLQYLRYLLEIEVEAQAHDALGDVLVLEKLFERLLDKIMREKIDSTEQREALSPNASEEAFREAINQMIEISSHPTILKIINFGKYNGQEIKSIASSDRGYLEWLLKQKEESDQIDEDWIYTLRHYLGMLQ